MIKLKILEKHSEKKDDSINQQLEGLPFEKPKIQESGDQMDTNSQGSNDSNKASRLNVPD